MSYKEIRLPWGDRLAIRASVWLASWAWIGSLTVGLVLLALFGRSERLDLYISVITLYIDQIILVAAQQQLKRSDHLAEYTLRLGENQLSMLKEEARVHAEMLAKLERLDRKL